MSLELKIEVKTIKERKKEKAKVCNNFEILTNTLNEIIIKNIECQCYFSFPFLKNNPRLVFDAQEESAFSKYTEVEWTPMGTTGS